jgi:hypothetical protein
MSKNKIWRYTIYLRRSIRLFQKERKIDRYGKRFYRTTDRSDLPPKIRQWSRDEYFLVSKENRKKIIKISDSELQEYIAISPKIQVSLVKLDRGEIHNRFRIIVEPYRTKISDTMDFEYAVGVNVYRAILHGIPDLANYKYSFPSNVDSETLNKTFNDGGDQSSMIYCYYDDLAHGVISAISMDQKYSLVDHVRDTMFTESQRKEISITKAVENLKYCINAAMDEVMGSYTMKLEEVEALIDIVKTKMVDTSIKKKALEHLVRFQNKINTYTIDQMIVDTLFVLKYNDKLDLSQIRNENRLYTMLMVRTVDGIKGKAYLVMYRESPITMRKEENTGFSMQELSKLLR